MTPSISGDVSLVQIKPSLWRTVQRDIFAIENESFPPSIREWNEALRKAALSPSSLVLAGKVSRGNSVVGYLLADRLESYGDVPGTKEDPHFGLHDTLYITSVAVHPKWRGKGLGTALQREARAWAGRQGYKRVAAHLRQGVATKLSAFYETYGSFDNWYDTGEAYDYVVFPLQ